MLIEINTDHNIHGNEKLNAYIRGVAEDTLRQVSSHLTRLEIFLKDEDNHKNGPDDKLCTMEARIEGKRPIAASHHASSIDLAVDGALQKIKREITTVLERRSDHRQNIDKLSHELQDLRQEESST